MNFFGCVPRFLKTHGSWVLTVFGLVGFGTTVILTAKEAPKVYEETADAQMRKIDEVWDKYPAENTVITNGWMQEHADEIYLTGWEKFKIAFPIYLPSIVSGLASAGCFLGAQIINAKQQTALLAAYGLLATEYDQYRQVIRETEGEETDRQAVILARKRTAELEREIERMKKENGPFLYAIDTLPDVVFEDKPANVHEALMHFNRNLILRGENNLAELYNFFGLPESYTQDPMAKNYGWNEYENEITFEAGYMDFDILPVETNSGQEIRLIHCFIPPYDLNANYGESDSPDFLGIVMPGYDPAYMIETLKRFPSEKVPVEHPSLYAPHI